MHDRFFIVHENRIQLHSTVKSNKIINYSFTVVHSDEATNVVYTLLSLGVKNPSETSGEKSYAPASTSPVFVL